MRRPLVTALSALLLLGGLPLASSQAATPTASQSERYALIVGITDYAGRTKSTLGGARDAGLVKNVLLAQGWTSRNIRVLTEQQASGRAIREGLAWLVGKSSPNTFSMFHYSGHVKQNASGEFLWSQDNTYLKDVEFSRIMKGVRGTGWTSISGCEAGAFNEGHADADHLFTASSKATEKSYEDPKTGTSVWSGELFARGIRDRGGDSNGDGTVTVQEAFAWAAPRATTITSKQQPHGPQTPQKAGWSGALDLAKPRTLR